MEIALALIGTPAILALPVGMIMLLFKKTRKNGLKISLISTAAIIAVAVALPHVGNMTATSEGYLSAQDKSLAEEAGYVSAKEWDKDRSKVLEQQRAERQKIIADARKELERAAKERDERALAETKAQKEQAANVAETRAKEKADEQSQKNAEQDPHKAKLAAKTIGMTEQIAATIRSYYQIEPQPLIPGRPLCREDGYCDFEAATMRIQVYGAGLAVLEATDQVSRTDYMEMCSIIFASISGADINFAGETVGLAYGAATRSGKYEQEVSGVKIDMTTAMSDTPECRFFRYGN